MSLFCIKNTCFLCCCNVVTIGIYSIMQGISFLDVMYSISLQMKVYQDHKEFKQNLMDSEIHDWLDMLLRLVDITGNNPEIYLKLFISGKQPTVIRDYSHTLNKIVCTYCSVVT